MSLEQLEELRKKARARKILIAILGAIAIITSVLLSMFSGISALQYLGFALAIILAKVMDGPIREYSKRYKETFVETELQKSFDNLIYRPFEGLNQLVISSTGMMRRGNSYESNDYIEADYNGVHFAQADVLIERRSSKTKDTIFKGRYMLFDFNKNFKTNMQIIQRGFVSATHPNYNSQVKFVEVSVENEAFNNMFCIRAQSEHDAYYILTPHFMEKMMRVTNEIGRRVMFCFVNNQLHVAIFTGKDSFEHSTLHKIDPQKEKEDVIKDIKLITAFVDDLNLDRKLFVEQPQQPKIVKNPDM